MLVKWLERGGEKVCLFVYFKILRKSFQKAGKQSNEELLERERR